MRACIPDQGEARMPGGYRASLIACHRQPGGPHLWHVSFVAFVLCATVVLFPLWHVLALRIAVIVLSNMWHYPKTLLFAGDLWPTQTEMFILPVRNPRFGSFRTQPLENLSAAVKLPTVSFHNFKSQNFKLSVSNPKNKYVAYVSVLSQISNCQGLGRKNNFEILKTDRITRRSLGNPTLGTNRGSRSLAVRIGCIPELAVYIICIWI